MPTTTYPDTQTNLDDDKKRGNPEIDHEDDTVIPDLDIDNEAGAEEDGEDFDTDDALDEAEDLEDGNEPEADDLPIEDQYGDEDDPLP